MQNRWKSLLVGLLLLSIGAGAYWRFGTGAGRPTGGTAAPCPSLLADKAKAAPGAKAIKASGAPVKLAPGVNPDLPRPEYPRPDLVRQDWLNLNGEWEFAFDEQNRGLKEEWYRCGPFPSRIQVPFAFQAPLSSIGDPSFHDVMWYRREVELPAGWQGQRLLLHFGAVDYEARVWVNGRQVAAHSGGNTPFTADMTDAVGPDGRAVIVVRAWDPSADKELPRGKQFWERREDGGIFYTRTSGIWQTVWLEPVPLKGYIDRVQIASDLQPARLRIRVELPPEARGLTVETEVRFGGRVVGAQQGSDPDQLISLSEAHYWSPEEPQLYDVTVKLTSGTTVVDQVETYAGVRSIEVRDGKVTLNGQPYYMKLVLDQGYWPDGLLTAPSDAALRADIEYGKAFGFNGARKHQKVEDPRWLYWADKLGYLVWGEMANAQQFSDRYVERMLDEWPQLIRRDVSHPSIVAWVPINESWGVNELAVDKRQVAHQLSLYNLTRSLDPTRPVMSNDGWEHAKSDFLTVHDYTGPEEIRSRYTSLDELFKFHPGNRELLAPGARYQGEPILVTEYGGIGLKVAQGGGWGYGNLSKDAGELLSRFRATNEALFSHPLLQGICYTQLTDVEYEVNGLMTYDRRPKVDPAMIKAILDQKPSRP